VHSHDVSDVPCRLNPNWIFSVVVYIVRSWRK